MIESNYSIMKKYLRINNKPYINLETPLDLFHNHSTYRVDIDVESWEMGFEVSRNQHNQYIFKTICIEDGHIKNNHVSLHDLKGTPLGKAIINYFAIGIGLIPPNETHEYLKELFAQQINWDVLI
jgi:hypothetical protein